MKHCTAVFAIAILLAGCSGKANVVAPSAPRNAGPAGEQINVLVGSKQYLCSTFAAAVLQGDLPAVRALVDGGADVNATQTVRIHGEDTWHEMPPLMLARLHMVYRGGSADMARFLLEKGADVNGADENGMTVLHSLAADAKGSVVNRKASEELAGLLIEAKADVNVRDAQGNTPGDYARANAEKNLPTIGELLSKRGMK